MYDSLLLGNLNCEFAAFSASYEQILMIVVILRKSEEWHKDQPLMF